MLQDVAFRGDPSIRRVSDLKYFVSKLKVEAEEARRLASLDVFGSLNSGTGLCPSFCWTCPFTLVFRVVNCASLLAITCVVWRPWRVVTYVEYCIFFQAFELEFVSFFFLPKHPSVKYDAWLMKLGLLQIF